MTFSLDQHHLLSVAASGQVVSEFWNYATRRDATLGYRVGNDFGSNKWTREIRRMKMSVDDGAVVVVAAAAAACSTFERANEFVPNLEVFE